MTNEKVRVMVLRQDRFDENNVFILLEQGKIYELPDGAELNRLVTAERVDIQPFVKTSLNDAKGGKA